MKVVVSDRAKFHREQIARYILRDFGEKALLDFRKAYMETKQFITHHPEGCQVEEHLSNEQYKYHFTNINGLTKLLYRIDGEKIYIVDMWDVRQEPPTFPKVHDY